MSLLLKLFLSSIVLGIFSFIVIVIRAYSQNLSDSKFMEIFDCIIVCVFYICLFTGAVLCLCLVWN